MLLVSIIIPVYNAEKYIEACLKSILIQEYDNIQILIINDGSTDESLNLIKKYADIDERIVVVSTNNSGQGHARNLGVSLSKGDVISFVDADDTVSADYISKNIQLFNKDIDFVQYPVKYKANQSNAYIRFQNVIEYSNNNEVLKSFFEHNAISWVVWDKLYSRSFIKKFQFNEEMIYEDNLFMLNVVANAKKVVLSNKGLYNYNSHETSTSNLGSSLYKKNIDTLVVLEQAVLLICEKVFLNKSILVDFVSRYINVYKSIKISNNQYGFNIFKILRDLRVIDIVFSKIALKEKIKILFYKSLK
jgi:glycosyltransferase involved in cell wall biosynthesis